MVFCYAVAKLKGNVRMKENTPKVLEYVKSSDQKDKFRSRVSKNDYSR